MSEIEVRELKTKDLFTVAKILLSLSDEATEEITELITRKHLQEKDQKEQSGSEEGDEEEEGEEEETEILSKRERVKNRYSLGMEMATQVIRIMLENAEGELIEWFADLTNMTKEEFLDTRMDAPLIVIDEISQQEGFVNFSQKAYSLYKKMNSSAKQHSEN